MYACTSIFLTTAHLIGFMLGEFSRNTEYPAVGWVFSGYAMVLYVLTSFCVKP